MKPLKVLILITKSNWGGAQRYVYDLATHLPKDRFEVEVMAGGSGPLIGKLAAAGIATGSDLASIERDISFLKELSTAWKLFRILRKKKPDILHVNSSKLGGIGSFAGRLAGVKRIVFTAHGWAFNEERPLAHKIYFRFLYWLTIAFSHVTIAVSQSAMAQVSSWPFVSGKITVIKNGLENQAGFSRSNARLELTRLNPALKRTVEGVSEANLIWIGTIAELHHIKGHEYAIRAFKECADKVRASDQNRRLVYTIISDGEDKDELSGLIDQLGLKEDILLLGHMDGASQYIRAFDIFMLASLSEGLGYVLLEAGAASVPVVATAVGGIPEVIDDMESGILVQPKRADELAHALSFMIDHPDERRGYGAALHEKVLRDFSLDKMISETVKAYGA